MRMSGYPLTLVVAMAFCLIAGCGRIPADSPLGRGPSTSPTGPGEIPSGAETTTCEYVAIGTATRPVELPSATEVPTSGTVSYVLDMTNGPVRLTLDRVKAPCTVHSFESLADQGFFRGTKCPRLVDKTFF